MAQRWKKKQTNKLQFSSQTFFLPSSVSSGWMIELFLLISTQTNYMAAPDLVLSIGKAAREETIPSTRRWYIAL